MVQPQEIISGSETEITCLVDDNCPDMKPTVTWMDIEGLEHHMVFARLEENNLSWKQTSTLKFLPSHKNNGQRLGCRVTYPGTELEYKGFVTMDVKCEFTKASSFPDLSSYKRTAKWHFGHAKNNMPLTGRPC